MRTLWETLRHEVARVWGGLRRAGWRAELVEPVGFAVMGLLAGAVVGGLAARAGAPGWVLSALFGAVTASAAHWLTLWRWFRKQESENARARARLDLLFAPFRAEEDGRG